MKILFFLIIAFQINLLSATARADRDSIRKELEVNFTGDAKIEVGSFYTGLAFHHSSPLPQRISFYYPAANSIDLSRDYWKRDSTFIMALGLEVDGKREWIGHEKYSFTSTPFSVSFFRNNKEKSVKISYSFCKDKPAFVQTIEIKNLSNQAKKIKLLFNLEASVRTSHTYNIKDKAWTESDQKINTLFINYDDLETQNAQIFVTNAGEKPIGFSTVSSINKLPLDTDTWWSNDLWKLDNKIIQKNNYGTPAARFLYEKNLKANESLVIVQIIGSSKQDEGKEFAGYLSHNYKKEVEAFENYMLDYAAAGNILTGDTVLDKSILWAKALLAVNQHYIDGSIQPMPCPAEYNFYFTHDVLLTDLAVVKFDLHRVKKDLQFIIEHADENYIIPHAYYWKDSVYKTEPVTTDGWNHFWFIILSASYLKHSSDLDFTRQLYPYVQKSLEQSLAGEKDGLMYAYRPDWWDIGRNYGPRAYMSILAIKAMKDFVEMSKVLSISSAEVIKYSELVKKMQINLNEKLWSDERNYLINFYEDGSEDPHYYMGSLLAVYFDLIDDERAEKLLQTTQRYLVDEKLGVYTVYPMDFHELIEFFKFAGNEAGDPHKYANGGIWPHCNAWYTLALIKTGKKKEALEFIKTTMTIDGIINSPNGQPAMYEYRNSNKDDQTIYGEIDKPQFMWAAGWYLYCIYELFQ